MKDSLYIGHAVYEILSGDTVLTGTLGTDIYPLVAEEGANFPFAIYGRYSLQAGVNKDGSDSISVGVGVYATDYDEGLDIASRIRTVFTSFRGTAGGFSIDSIKLDEAIEKYEDGVFSQLMTFDIEID